mmetsp:Transcript_17866/g.30346  ORF Transcript_17866/g.30346 Transcript_17866/m.30346 type:complete len:137 (+) Transcript_17866:56-466(+)
MNLKLFPWVDWDEWHFLYQLIFPPSASPHELFQSSSIDLRKLYGSRFEDAQIMCQQLSQALLILNGWFRKNVGGADHMKALKMQKIIITELLSHCRYEIQAMQSGKSADFDLMTDERIVASSFRIIQLVELGAKTV